MSKNRIFKPKIFTNQTMEATVEYITADVLNFPSCQIINRNFGGCVVLIMKLEHYR